MNYDLTNKESRKKFVRYANSLLKNQRASVKLRDETGRTKEQNKYIHVLFRIFGQEFGETEEYVKQVYFKEFANREIFCKTTKDSITGQLVTLKRSTCDLSIPEMRRAIENFRNWSAEQGCYLPEANIKDDGSLEFASEEDEKAYHQAEIQTSNLEE